MKLEIEEKKKSKLLRMYKAFKKWWNFEVKAGQLYKNKTDNPFEKVYIVVIKKVENGYVLYVDRFHSCESLKESTFLRRYEFVSED